MKIFEIGKNYFNLKRDLTLGEDNWITSLEGAK